MEGAHHVDQRVHALQNIEVFAAYTAVLAQAFRGVEQVDILDLGVGDALGLEYASKYAETLIGHLGGADVRLGSSHPTLWRRVHG